MTTYSAITAPEIAQDAPVTQPLMQKIRDNPIAIGEADASVPAGLLPSVLLGTIATTSGTSASLSSLNLVPYRFLRFVVTGVSLSVSGSPTLTRLTLEGDSCSPTNNGAGFGWQGIIDLVLSTGGWVSTLRSTTSPNDSDVAESWAGDSSYSTATTTVTFGLNGVGNFDAGSIQVYGIK